MDSESTIKNRSEEGKNREGSDIPGILKLYTFTKKDNRAQITLVLHSFVFAENSMIEISND